MTYDECIRRRFFDILEDGSYGMIPAPTDPELGFEVLSSYLLPKGWYSTSGGGSHQVNTEIVFDILMKYSPEFRKEYKRRLKNGKKV